MKAFPTQKMRETQMKISLMNSIHRTSNVLIFSQMRLKVFFQFSVTPNPCEYKEFVEKF